MERLGCRISMSATITRRSALRGHGLVTLNGKRARTIAQYLRSDLENAPLVAAIHKQRTEQQA